jgi:integrase
MTERRKPGQGTIRQLPSGRWQIGLTLANGKRAWSKVTYATKAEAESALVGCIEALALGGNAPTGGVTFRKFAERTLDLAELGRTHAPSTIDAYRASLRTQLDDAPWIDDPIVSLEVRPVGKHLHRVAARRERSTANIALAVIRLVFLAAKDDELVSVDPSAGFRFKREAHRVEIEKRSFITPTQFDALCAVATPAERCMFKLALGTGLRVKELALLHLADWHPDADAPHVVVRYGSIRGARLGPPKNGKVRTTMLLGPALDAAREWTRVHLPKLKNSKALVFPSRSGGYRKGRILQGCTGRGKARKFLWAQLLEAAGLADVAPAIVWHSFRHTCATSLLSGLWGHKWAPEEVMHQLGHEDIKTTLGYAKVVEERLAELAKITTGSRGSGGTGATSRNGEGNATLPAHVAAQHVSVAAPEAIRALGAAGDHGVIAVYGGDAGPLREWLETLNAAAAQALASSEWVRLGIELVGALRAPREAAQVAKKTGGAS